MSDLAKRMMKVFQGYTKRFGRFEVAGDRRADGKRDGKAWTPERAPEERDFEDHIAGRARIGIVPLGDDLKCAFGAIDVDRYPIDINLLVRETAHEPLFVF